VTALVDGQLSAEAVERAHIHLAGCRACRDLVEAERASKALLGALDGPEPGAELVGRLLGLGGPAGPLRPRSAHVPGTPRPATLALPASAPSRRPVRTRPGNYPAPRATRTRPGPVAPSGPGRGRPVRRRARLAVAVVGALSVVGVGVTAFGVVAVSSAPAVVPPVDSFIADQGNTVEETPFTQVTAGWLEGTATGGVRAPR
jgi:hypothetical protein